MKPNTERLQLLIALLAEVSARKWKPSAPVNYTGAELALAGRHRFDITKWFGFKDSVELMDEKQPTHCGYTACAVGHACLDSRFTTQGLTMFKDMPSYETSKGRCTGWRAVQDFFGISREEAEYLFHDSHYTGSKGPAAVANRLRGFIAERK